MPFPRHSVEIKTGQDPFHALQIHAQPQRRTDG